jgi:hypothetical protein
VNLGRAADEGSSPSFEGIWDTFFPVCDCGDDPVLGKAYPPFGLVRHFGVTLGALSNRWSTWPGAAAEVGVVWRDLAVDHPPWMPGAVQLV